MKQKILIVLIFLSTRVATGNSLPDISIFLPHKADFYTYRTNITTRQIKELKITIHSNKELKGEIESDENTTFLKIYKKDYNEKNYVRMEIEYAGSYQNFTNGRAILKEISLYSEEPPHQIEYILKSEIPYLKEYIYRTYEFMEFPLLWKERRYFYVRPACGKEFPFLILSRYLNEIDEEGLEKIEKFQYYECERYTDEKRYIYWKKIVYKIVYTFQGTAMTNFVIFSDSEYPDRISCIKIYEDNEVKYEIRYTFFGDEIYSTYKIDGETVYKSSDLEMIIYGLIDRLRSEVVK